MCVCLFRPSHFPSELSALRTTHNRLSCHSTSSLNGSHFPPSGTAKGRTHVPQPQWEFHSHSHDQRGLSDHKHSQFHHKETFQSASHPSENKCHPCDVVCPDPLQLMGALNLARKQRVGGVQLIFDVAILLPCQDKLAHENKPLLGKATPHWTASSKLCF